MMQYAYQDTRCCYRVDGEKHSYHQRRGVKEGCPLSPLLFCVVYEMFHGTLAAEFPSVHLYTYMDDVAFVLPDRSTTLAVLKGVTDLGNTLGLHVNKAKTEVCCWSATYKVDQLLWDGQVNTVRPRILSYLGHTIAHAQWAHAQGAIGLLELDYVRPGAVCAYSHGWLGTKTGGQLHLDA